ncbi:hypothetical protein OCU04_008063, partial [Sclerotinia nivalis]
EATNEKINVVFAIAREEIEILAKKYKHAKAQHLELRLHYIAFEPSKPVGKGKSGEANTYDASSSAQWSVTA